MFNSSHLTVGLKSARITTTIYELSPGKMLAEKPQVKFIPPQPLKGGNPYENNAGETFQKLDVKGLDQDFIDASQRMEKGLRMEATWTYDDGFGTIVTRSKCRWAGVTDYGISDLTKKVLPIWQPDSDCALVEAAMRAAYHKKQTLDEEYEKNLKKQNTQ
jgi:hypothetical protein